MFEVSRLLCCSTHGKKVVYSSLTPASNTGIFSWRPRRPLGHPHFVFSTMDFSGENSAREIHGSVDPNSQDGSRPQVQRTKKRICNLFRDVDSTRPRPAKTSFALRPPPPPNGFGNLNLSCNETMSTSSFLSIFIETNEVQMMYNKVTEGDKVKQWDSSKNTQLHFHIKNISSCSVFKCEIQSFFCSHMNIYNENWLLCTTQHKS